jgi:acyl dehydratase
MSKLYFEDINVGDTFVGDKVTVHPERMLAFAQEFDSQPMHLDPAAAKAIGLDDIIACGGYTFSLSAKSCIPIWDKIHFLPSGLGFQMSFVKPVYAGDELQLHIEVVNKRPSRNPSRGVLELKQALHNQKGVSVLDLENVIWLVRTTDSG